MSVPRMVPNQLPWPHSFRGVSLEIIERCHRPNQLQEIGLALDDQANARSIITSAISSAKPARQERGSPVELGDGSPARSCRDGFQLLATFPEPSTSLKAPIQQTPHVQVMPIVTPSVRRGITPAGNSRRE